MKRIEPRGEMYCSICDEEMTWLSREIAALFLGLSEFQVERLAETGELHARKKVTGTRLICIDSLYDVRKLTGDVVTAELNLRLAAVSGL